MRDMPTNEQCLSEQFRLAAKAWVELDGAARLLEDSKDSILSTRKTALGDIADAKATRIVKASQEWQEHIKIIVDARTRANLARMKMKWIEIKISEWHSQQANDRIERKSYGTP